MNILFIGGTGNISTACAAHLHRQGHTIHVLTRGRHPVSADYHAITADRHDPDEMRRALAEVPVDVALDFIAFDIPDIEADIELLQGRVRQFIFISSASIYQTPPETLPVTEDTPLHNPFWEYSRKKIACEALLRAEFERSGFPYTIVRPSHTYDKAYVPLEGGYTVLDRMKRGKPIMIHGDGTSIWTLTHQKDFAKGFVGLLGKQEAIGQAFHITSDEWLS